MWIGWINAIWRDFKNQLEKLNSENPEVRREAALELQRTFANAKRRKETFDSLRDQSKDLLLAILRSDEDVRVLRAVAVALGRLGVGEAEEMLIEALRSDEDVEVRRAAAEVLADLSGSQAVEVLIDALRNEESAEVRQEIVRKLADIGGPRVVEVLIEALHNDRSVCVRETIVDKLEDLEDNRIIDGLIETLRNEEDAEVRLKVASRLAVCGDARALKALLEAMRSDRDVQVRLIAAAVIGAFANWLSLTSHDGGQKSYFYSYDIDLDAIILDLDDKVIEETLKEAQEVWNKKFLQLDTEVASSLRERAVEALIETLKRDTDVEVRQIAAAALLDYFSSQRQLGEDQILDIITHALKNVIYYNERYDLMLLRCIVDILMEIGNEKAIEILSEIILNMSISTSMDPMIVVPEDAESQMLEVIAEEIIDALADLKGDNAVETLLRLLMSENYQYLAEDVLLKKFDLELVANKILEKLEQLKNDCSDYLAENEASDSIVLYYYQDIARLLGKIAARLNRIDLVLNNLSIGKVITESIVNGFLEELSYTTPTPELLRNLNLLRSHPNVRISYELVRQIDKMLSRSS